MRFPSVWIFSILAVSACIISLGLMIYYKVRWKLTAVRWMAFNLIAGILASIEQSSVNINYGYPLNFLSPFLYSLTLLGVSMVDVEILKIFAFLDPRWTEERMQMFRKVLGSIGLIFGILPSLTILIYSVSIWQRPSNTFVTTIAGLIGVWGLCSYGVTFALTYYIARLLYTHANRFSKSIVLFDRSMYIIRIMFFCFAGSTVSFFGYIVPIWYVIADRYFDVNGSLATITMLFLCLHAILQIAQFHVSKELALVKNDKEDFISDSIADNLVLKQVRVDKNRPMKDGRMMLPTSANSESIQFDRSIAA